LTGDNAFSFDFPGRWFKPTSRNPEKRDVGAGQRRETAKLKTFAAANVWKIPEERHWSRPTPVNSWKTDVGHDQHHENNRTKTLDGPNVRKIAEQRH
jgi:hypothetical protein